MKKKTMYIPTFHIKILLFLSLSILLVGCSKPIIGDMTEIGKFSSKEELRSLYKQYDAPIIVLIGNHLYIPPQVCLDPRKFGSDVAKRSAGGATEARTISGEAEARNISGGMEERNLTGDVQKRDLTGETEKREAAAVIEERTAKGESIKREPVSKAEVRTIHGESDPRSIAGGVEARSMAGDSQARNLGGGSVGVLCYDLYKQLGFRLLNVNSSAKVKVFDGYEIRDVEGRVVEY